MIRRVFCRGMTAEKEPRSPSRHSIAQAVGAVGVALVGATADVAGHRRMVSVTRKVVLTVTVTVTVNKIPGNAFCQKRQRMLIIGQGSESGQ